MASTFDPTLVPPEPHGPVISATRARSARWGLHVFWMLVASTILAVGVLFGVWAFHFGDSAVSDKLTNRDAATTFQTPMPATPAATPAAR